ncbi:MAG: alkaline phosphatase family protein [Pirellulales bacterium]|nr:alkaline phosphatase family protein [Pirellulales bacterium]
MPNLFRLLVALLLAAAFLPVGPASGEPRQDRCVVLVSVDGFAHFYLDDPRSDIPTIRKLAREGARAQGMVCAFPTVTWPNHVTMATGAAPARHGVLGNSYLDRTTGKPVSLLPDPIYDKDQIVRVPMIFDAAHQAGLRTAGICWPATRNARTLDWTVPDMAGDGWETFGTKSWLEELRAAGLPVDRQADWCREPAGGVQRDWLYTRMAAQVLTKHAPNLLLIHLVEPDHVQHRTGPRSDEAYWCMSYTDDRIRDLVEAVQRSPMAGKTTIFVCGDHGFLPIRKDIRPNVLLRQMGLIALSDGKVEKQAAWCLSQGGACAVYVLDDARRQQIIGELRTALAKTEGVDAVFTPERFAQLGQPTPEQDPHAPDLWLSAKKDYSFSDTAAGDEIIAARPSVGGTHGFLPDQPDLLSACIIHGPDIQPGTDLGKVDIRDVAPTIGAILGIELPTAQGKSLMRGGSGK